MVQRLGHKRRKPQGARTGGWTPQWIEVFRKWLQCYLPVAFFTFKYRSPQVDRVALRKALADLDKAIRNAAYRHNYRAAWCVFIEYGPEAGYHFHLWCATVPPQRMRDALRRHWLVMRGLVCNSEKVFHYSGKARSRERVASYLGKVRSGPCVCKHRFKTDGRWKPFRFHRGASVAPPTAIDGNDVTECKKCFFPRTNSVPVECANPLFLADSGPAHPSRGRGPVHLMRGHTGTQTLNGIGIQRPPVAPRAVRIGLRIMPRYGAGDALTYPDNDEAAEIKAHLQRLSTRWTLDKEVLAGPEWPAGSLEVAFLIPAGKVREFERAAAAPLRGFGRIFRP